ncbi:MAG: MFS transporter, partial [Bacillus sp. (in: firmicutes)]
MSKKIQSKLLTMKGFYLLTFFGVGSISPLLSVYMSEVINFSGYQIGTIMSVGPIMMIFFQPIWGMVSDRLNAPVKVLTTTTLLAGLISAGYLFFQSYFGFLAIAILVALFQSAIIPISDSVSLAYCGRVKANYGSIRLYGSLGFGLAVFVMGRLSEINENVIFYSFFFALAIASILATRLPQEKANAAGNKRLLSGMRELFLYKKFLLFLAITFMIFGPNLANNVYFGLFVENQGGSYTGIGIAFLIAVLSEIPFMRLAGRFTRRYGLLPVVAVAGMVSLARWFFYYTEPNLWVIYVSAFLQGASIGLFIPAALQYVRDITPAHMTATAIT